MRHSKSRCCSSSVPRIPIRSGHSDISELVESRSEDPDRSGDADESAPVRLETAPTGPGENIELPNYFLKPHETAPTGIESIYLFLEFTNSLSVPSG